MDLGDIVIATITWARSPADRDLLIPSLETLTRTGLPVVVSDRGTDETFLQALRTLPCSVAASTHRSLVAQVQQSVAAAAALGRRFVCYVEPDKQQFFDEHLLDFFRRAPADDEVGVAIAARSASSFSTFPPTQRYAEQVINDLCSTSFGAPGDYSYGPFVMHRALTPRIAALPVEIGWGWRHAVFGAAAGLGLRTVHIIGDYACPTDQRTESDSERAHRIRQLSQNLLGLLEGTNGQPPEVPSNTATRAARPSPCTGVDRFDAD